MFKITEEILPLVSYDALENGLFLGIWYPQQKSPHIGISSEGKYFSLLIDGKQEMFPVQKLISASFRKKSSLLLIQLHNSISALELSSAFSDYTNCEIDKISCSVPMLKLYGIEKKEGFLFDLLDKLQILGCLERFYKMNLPEGFDGIPSYRDEVVEQNLQSLLL